MSSHWPNPVAKYFRLFFAVLILTVAADRPSIAYPQQDTVRTIVADDFTRNRAGAGKQRKPARKASKSGSESSSGRNYRLASQPLRRPVAQTGSPGESQLGLTIWKLRISKFAVAPARLQRGQTGVQQLSWIAERAEADTQFREGDYVRLSVESPRAGYLYVIDRDWFTNRELGETSLIFPIRGDDNRLFAGRLIDVPAEDRSSFKANPKPNQAGEILTIIVTSTPLPLPISDQSLPISNAQLRRWQEMWEAAAERFELQGGAGQLRTREEQEAAARNGKRQLTRDDPAPQTIYLLNPKSRDAFLFDVKLSYVR